MAQGRWLPILVVYATGTLAAAQLGKLSALMPLIQRDLSLELALAALLVSLIEAGGATLGFVAGTVARHVGLKRALLAGVALLAVAGLGASQAAGASALFVWRSLEAAGYLAIVVAAPSLMATIAGAEQRLALALWSTFFPVGFALGSMASGATADWLSWRAVLLGGGIIAAVALIPVCRLPAPDEKHDGDGAMGRLPASVWCLSLGFGCYTTFEVGVLAMLPAYFTGQAGFPASIAGLVTGLASVATIAGSTIAAYAMQRQRRSAGLMTVGILVPAGMLFVVFVPLGDWWLAAAMAVLLNAISGIVPALTFARLPDAVGPRGSLATANGLLAQCGAAGSLLGPPLLASAAAGWGWPSAAAVGAAASLLCARLVGAADRHQASSRTIPSATPGSWRNRPGAP